MKITDIIIRAGRNLRRAKLRTLLTAVAIAIGGFAITASLAAGEGARQYIDRIISSNIDPQSLMVTRDEKVMGMNNSASFAQLQEYNPNTASMYGMNVKTLTQHDADELAKNPNIKSVQPQYMVSPKFVEFGLKKDKKYTAQVDIYPQTIKKRTAAGSLPNLGADIGVNEVAIPESYLGTLGLNSAKEAIGSEMTITVSQTPQEIKKEEFEKVFASEGEAGLNRLIEKSKGKTITKKLKIVAVIGKDPSSMMSPSYIFISSNLARELSEFSTAGTSQYQKYIGAIVFARDGKNVDELKTELKQKGYTAMTAKDMQGMLFTFVNILQSVVLGFGILALIVSIFGIVNTQYISVLERTKQIGLMKALGASRRDVARLFRYEAAWVGFFGGALGVLLAWGIGTALNPLITEKLGLGEGNFLLVFQAPPAVGVVILLMLVAIIAGWLPSRKAAKLDPIEALRTE